MRSIMKDGRIEKEAIQFNIGRVSCLFTNNLSPNNMNMNKLSKLQTFPSQFYNFKIGI